MNYNNKRSITQFAGWSSGAFYNPTECLDRIYIVSTGPPRKRLNYFAYLFVIALAQSLTNEVTLLAGTL